MNKYIIYTFAFIAVITITAIATTMNNSNSTSYSMVDVVALDDFGITFDDENPLVRNGEIKTVAATPGANESETGFETALSNTLTLSFATKDYKNKKTAVNEFVSEYTNCEFDVNKTKVLEIEPGDDYCMLAVIQENLLDGSPTANLYVQKEIENERVGVVVLVTEQKIDTGDTVESVLATFGEEYVSDLRLLTESIN